MPRTIEGYLVILPMWLVKDSSVGAFYNSQEHQSLVYRSHQLHTKKPQQGNLVDLINKLGTLKQCPLWCIDIQLQLDQCNVV